MARGRDATDAAITTSFGTALLQGFPSKPKSFQPSVSWLSPLSD